MTQSRTAACRSHLQYGGDDSPASLVSAPESRTCGRTAVVSSASSVESGRLRAIMESARGGPIACTALMASRVIGVSPRRSDRCAMRRVLGAVLRVCADRSCALRWSVFGRGDEGEQRGRGQDAHGGYGLQESHVGPFGRERGELAFDAAHADLEFGDLLTGAGQRRVEGHRNRCGLSQQRTHVGYDVLRTGRDEDPELAQQPSDGI